MQKIPSANVVIHIIHDSHELLMKLQGFSFLVRYPYHYATTLKLLLISIDYIFHISLISPSPLSSKFLSQLHILLCLPSSWSMLCSPPSQYLTIFQIQSQACHLSKGVIQGESTGMKSIS